MRGSAINCQHDTKVRRKLTGAGYVLRSQCAKCGHYGDGNAQALPLSRLRGRPIESVPLFDEKAFEAAAEELYSQQRQEYWARKLEVLIEGPPRVIAANDPYYSSESWREKRVLVMNRAGGVCEGCGLRDAAQVHHLHYRTFGNEFLWDLRAVCRECHERIHNIQDIDSADRVEHVRNRARGAAA